MSTMAAVPRDNRAPGFWASTVGKKIVMAVTGILLFVFVIGHLLGNLQVFEGPAKLNAYGAFLHNIGEFLWPVRMMGRILTELGKATVAIGRIHDILGHQRESRHRE